jgi:ATP-dependent exoDNAse (exonuclease V) beta subunit
MTPKNFNLHWSHPHQIPKSNTERCRYCNSKNIIKRGWRKKKLERIQLYKCKACERTFTAQILKHKQFPLKIILDAISLFNLGHSEGETCKLIKEKYGVTIKQSSLSRWVKEHAPLCRYVRLRPKTADFYSPNQIIQSTTLRHQQIYHYRYHQAKLDILLESREFNRLKDLRIWLESVKKNCPHKLFQGGTRSSQAKGKIDMHQVQVNHMENYATRLARLLLQAVGDNRLRHDALQQFMLANDSATVAMEVPIYLTQKDISHFTQKLNFNIPFNITETLSGHIDLLQLRNGLIHILDYKPKAKKEKPFAQLTLYALALSRLTGLKLMDFKCAWFDESDYFEFFPLHVVHKKRS